MIAELCRISFCGVLDLSRRKYIPREIREYFKEVGFDGNQVDRALEILRNDDPEPTLTQIVLRVKEEITSGTLGGRRTHATFDAITEDVEKEKTKLAPQAEREFRAYLKDYGVSEDMMSSAIELIAEGLTPTEAALKVQSSDQPFGRRRTVTSALQSKKVAERKKAIETQKVADIFIITPQKETTFGSLPNVKYGAIFFSASTSLSKQNREVLSLCKGLGMISVSDGPREVTFPFSQLLVPPIFFAETSTVTSEEKEMINCFTLSDQGFMITNRVLNCKDTQKSKILSRIRAMKSSLLRFKQLRKFSTREAFTSRPCQELLFNPVMVSLASDVPYVSVSKKIEQAIQKTSPGYKELDSRTLPESLERGYKSDLIKGDLDDLIESLLERGVRAEVLGLPFNADSIFTLSKIFNAEESSTINSPTELYVTTSKATKVIIDGLTGNTAKELFEFHLSVVS